MELKEIKDERIWTDFLLDIQPNTFLQSWQWKQVQENPAVAPSFGGAMAGEETRALGFYKNNTLVAVALLITVQAKRGIHYLCPHGPIVKNNSDFADVLKQLTAYCLQLRTKSKAVALRVAPLIEKNAENRELFSSLKFRPSPMHVHAELTWVLDISKGEDEILAGMRKTTRHAITKAKKEGVNIEISQDASSLERFFPLYETTKNRHGFVPFSKKAIASQVDIFRKNNMMYFAIATHKGEDVAAAILIQFGSTVFYYHGASTKTSSQVPSAQLLQWEAIREAKRRGATRYNFWGIARDDEPNHPFAGITVFKKGFGGYAIDYMHAQDLPLSWKYWVLWAIEMFRKKKRGF